MILRAEHFVSGTTRLEGAGRQSENLQALANSDCPESEFTISDSLSHTTQSGVRFPLLNHCRLVPRCRQLCEGKVDEKDGSI
jgi:hypothetical protein